MNPKNILLIRHGESRSNMKKMLTGRGETELTPRGKSQARKIAVFIKRRYSPIDRIYSSPLKRALSTALTISRKLKVSVVPSELLLETDFGNWEGMSREELARQPEWELYVRDPFHFKFPGGESPQDVKKRVLRFREELRREGEWNSIAIVSHYTPIVFFIMSALGDEHSLRAPFKIANASLTVIESLNGNDCIGMMNFTP